MSASAGQTDVHAPQARHIVVSIRISLLFETSVLLFVLIFSLTFAPVRTFIQVIAGILLL